MKTLIYYVHKYTIDKKFFIHINLSFKFNDNLNAVDCKHIFHLSSQFSLPIIHGSVLSRQ